MFYINLFIFSKKWRPLRTSVTSSKCTNTSIKCANFKPESKETRSEILNTVIFSKYVYESYILSGPSSPFSYNPKLRIRFHFNEFFQNFVFVHIKITAPPTVLIYCICPLTKLQFYEFFQCCMRSYKSYNPYPRDPSLYTLTLTV